MEIITIETPLPGRNATDRLVATLIISEDALQNDCVIHREATAAQPVRMTSRWDDITDHEFKNVLAKGINDLWPPLAPNPTDEQP